MKKTQRIALLLVLVFMFTIATAGCSNGDKPAAATESTKSEVSDTGSAKDTLVYGSTWADATSLDPAVDYTSKSRYILEQIYDPLFFFDDERGLSSAIADSYDVSDDGIYYTFHIREGALFHDGNQIKASDVVFSIERAKEASFISRFVSHIDTATAIDDLTVEVKLKAAFAPFIRVISGLLIVSEKAITEMGDRYGLDGAVGSGPYMLKEWKTGEYTLLERFEDYYLGPSPIKYVKVVGIPDKNAMLIALETGQVDLTNNISSADVEIIKSNPDLTLYQQDTSHMFWFLLNNTKFPFNNKLLRQAVNYAANKENILLAEKSGLGKLADSNYMLAPQSFGYTSNEATKNYPYDPEKAKALLTEAGYPNGFEFTINALSGWGDKAAEALQADLKAVGITANIELLEDTVSFANIAALTYQTDVMGTNDTYLDADMLYDRYHTGAGNNQIGYSNPEVDALLETARKEQDEAKRVELYDRIVAILKDDACIIPCYFEDYLAASSSKLKGFELESNTHINRWYGLYFE
jgi:peptide/nickel transport system substrate-binding protein